MSSQPDLKPFKDEWLARRGNFYALITPDKAAELMARNTNNRRIKNRKIANYARDMAAGKWDPDASALMFDWDQNLIDGQNRLLACIEADVPFGTLLRTGLNPASRDHVDTGAARTTADAFRMHGVTDQNIVAAAVGLRNRYDLMREEGRTLGRSYQYPAMTHRESLEYLTEHPALEKMMGAARALHQMAPGVTRSVWVAFASMIGESNEEAARRFASSLLTGEVTGTGDPLLALTRYLAQAQAPKQAGNRDRNSAMRNLWACIKTWNAWVHNTNIDKIVIRDDETAPEVV